MGNSLYHLAKAELHCHLDGSLSLEAIRRLAALADIALPQSDTELSKLVTAPEKTESLVDYLRTFDIIRPLLQTKEALRLAAYDVARQAAAEHVIYIEIRFAPELSMDKGLTAVQTVEAVEEGLKQAQADFGIVAKALICGMRQSSQQLTKDIFGQISAAEGLDYAGFDFAGNEHDFPPEDIAELIRYTQSLERPMTFHAGECGCPSHIAQSIALGLKRLGHVTAIHDHPELIADFVKNEVTAELCLTSNLQTKAAKSLAAFPYQELYEAGAKLTINTDNRTVSNTSLTKEYQLFADYFGTSQADFYHFNQNAIEASFASAAEKAELLAALAAAYQEID
ncbi:adenosine deaminase [Streptococcus caviae]|uniref:adenosine deaminase n=1 Tax=Streptococcus sp. 'caviae' TaxID=1915004 RepID=UPI00095B36EC|nr:adenosine deaminase [Streptococcus sp. 'caviae']OLN82808.1 adenosine deaminase [Streptococcus sp. 'caviae']